MMKKEDLKKHCKEEKPDLRNAVIISFIFLLIFNSPNLYSQIPVNGFCRYREFPVQPGFTNLFAIDYNSDGYRDLIAFDPQRNNYSTLTSDSKSNFGTAAAKSSSIFLSNLHMIGSESNRKNCIVLSRKTRELCEISFSKNGLFTVSSKQKLDGYPSSLDLGDVNGDKNSEIIISGSALDGLKLFTQSKRTIKQKDKIKGKVFGSSIFVDLNYDSYADIVAFDLSSHSISFYMNNGIGEFEESKSIKVDSDISEMKVEDYNSDGFIDLLFLKNNQLNIFYGDSVSSFKKQTIFQPDASIDKYTIYDFNGDGFNDVAFINKVSGTLSVSFAKGSNAFYAPIVYLKKNGLCDLTSYVDRGGRKLAALSSEGKIFLINSLQFQETLSSISLGIAPVAVQTFDYGNDSYKDIAFIDSGSQSIKIGLSERKNLFRSYHEIMLSTSANKLLVDDKNKNVKTFICYKVGERFVELIRYDFTSGKINRLVFYLDSNVKELVFTSDRLVDRIILYTTIGEEDKLYLQSVIIRNFKVASQNSIGVSVNAVASCLHLNVYRDVYCLYKDKNQNVLVKSIVDEKVNSQSRKLSWEVKPEETFSISFASISELVNRSKPVAALQSSNGKSIFHYFAGERTTDITLRNYIYSYMPMKYFIENENELLFFSYDEQKGKMYQLRFTPNQKKITESVLVEMKGINDYLVTNLDSKNRFLFFTNEIQITLKRF